jgi:iron(III) transport system permease protein
LARNGLVCGFFISFVLALGELGTTLLIIPPGMTTMPIKIYNFMHYGAEATVAALCLILLALQLLFSLALLGITRWNRE